MKAYVRSLFVLFLILGSLSNAQASTSEASHDFNYKFSKFDGEIYQYSTKASDSSEALQRAAEACFNHFKAGRHVSMDKGQDIIDICVNPRRI